LALHIIKNLSQTDTLPLRISNRIFGKYVFKALGDEAALVIVGSGVGAVFIFVDSGDVDSEERGGEVGGEGGVGEIGVDYQELSRGVSECLVGRRLDLR